MVRLLARARGIPDFEDVMADADAVIARGSAGPEQVPAEFRPETDHESPRGAC